MENIIMDGFAIKANGELDLCDENDKFWGDWNVQSNKTAKMYFDLYKTGKLQKIVEYITENPGTKNLTLVDFIINGDKLSEELLDEFEKNYPENALRDSRTWCRSHYVACTGIVHRPRCSYRDVDGCIGRSFEHPYIQMLSTSNVYDVYETAQETGVIPACIKTIKMINGIN